MPAVLEREEVREAVREAPVAAVETPAQVGERLALTVARKELHEALRLVSRAVASYTSLPTLKTVLMEATEAGLRLAATDLELAIEAVVPATVRRPGRICVPARTLGEIISQLPEGDVTLTSEDGARIRVQCGRSDSRILGLDAEDYPSLPEVLGELTFSIPQAVLKAALRQTVVAAIEDDTRPIMCGVYLRIGGGTLAAVATDTHKLAVRKVPLEASGEGAAIVPLVSVKEILGALGESGEATVMIDQGQIRVRTERVTITSRIIEGAFPKYDRVVPAAFTRRWTMRVDEFRSCLRRARVAAKDCSAVDRVIIAPTGLLGSIRITGTSDTGSIVEECEMETEGFDAEPITIAFNSEYLLEALGVMGTERVHLDMTEALSPAVLRPDGGDDYLMLVMPMQVQ